MKKSLLMTAAVLATALPFAAPWVHAASQMFEGTISDSMCEKKHMMPGKTDAECIKACVEAGSDYVLVADKKVYTLKAKPTQLADFAGKHVTIEGELKQNTITVTSIR